MTDFKIGDTVTYIGKQQNHCYGVPNVGIVDNITDKRVMVRWRKRDGSISHGRTHPLRPYNVAKVRINYESSYDPSWAKKFGIEERAKI